MTKFYARKCTMLQLYWFKKNLHPFKITVTNKKINIFLFIELLLCYLTSLKLKVKDILIVSFRLFFLWNLEFAQHFITVGFDYS